MSLSDISFYLGQIQCVLFTTEAQSLACCWSWTNAQWIKWLSADAKAFLVQEALFVCCFLSKILCNLLKDSTTGLWVIPVYTRVVFHGIFTKCLLSRIWFCMTTRGTYSYPANQVWQLDFSLNLINWHFSISFGFGGNFTVLSLPQGWSSLETRKAGLWEPEWNAWPGLLNEYSKPIWIFCFNSSWLINKLS